MPAAVAGNAAVIRANTRAGRNAELRAANGDAVVQTRQLSGDRTEVTTTSGHALMLRDATTGDLLAIGWDGRAVVRHTGAMTVTVSNGVRSVTSRMALR